MDAAIVRPVGTFIVTVTRCGCDPNPGAHAFLEPPQPCPNPRLVERVVEEEIHEEIRGTLKVGDN